MRNYLQTVKDQYETYPYPLRDPNEELNGLWSTYGGHLREINYYCFAGKETFRNGFRVLDAGGGTGDSTIFLAEQLRDIENAEVVYADISLASMEIAKERARIRGLNNITFLHKSILDFPDSDEMGKFDYIVCSGVLHHLEDASVGLAALKSRLKEKGALSLMVYGKYGRTGLYQIQNLMKMINQKTEDMSQKIVNTRLVVESLPKSNWFKRGEDLMTDHINFGDIGYYDLFLHSHDRCFDVPELYAWLKENGLNLIEFVITEFRNMLDPKMSVSDPKLLELIQAFDKKEQQAMMEIIVGNIYKHTIYASTLENPKADVYDLDMVPFFNNISPEGVYEFMEQKPEQDVIFRHENGYNVLIKAQKYTKLIFKYLDGHRSLGDIIKEIGGKEHEILQDFVEIFESFVKLDWMLLRHKSVPMGIPVEDLQGRMLKIIKKET